MTRRDLLKLMIASGVAAGVDPERLLWTPKPIVTVPALPPVFIGADMGRKEWTAMYVRAAVMEGLRGEIVLQSSPDGLQWVDEQCYVGDGGASRHIVLEGKVEPFNLQRWRVLER